MSNAKENVHLYFNTDEIVKHIPILPLKTDQLWTLQIARIRKFHQINKKIFSTKIRVKLAYKKLP